MDEITFELIKFGLISSAIISGAFMKLYLDKWFYGNTNRH
jgi:hypothetical protein